MAEGEFPPLAAELARKGNLGGTAGNPSRPMIGREFCFLKHENGESRTEREYRNLSFCRSLYRKFEIELWSSDRQITI
jgi:hypothetical protein